MDLLINSQKIRVPAKRKPFSPGRPGILGDALLGPWRTSPSVAPPAKPPLGWLPPPAEVPGLLFPRDSFPEPAQIRAALPWGCRQISTPGSGPGWTRCRGSPSPVPGDGPGTLGGPGAPAAEPEESGRQLGEVVAKRAETAAPGKAVPAAQHLGPVVAVQAAASSPVPRHLPPPPPPPPPAESGQGQGDPRQISGPRGRWSWLRADPNGLCAGMNPVPRGQDHLAGARTGSFCPHPDG